MAECPRCHHSNSLNAAYCMHCGTNLRPLGITEGQAQDATVSQESMLADPAQSFAETLLGKSPSSQSQQSVTLQDDAPATSNPAIGAVVDGKYRIKSVIGEGGMGIVYLADDIHMQVPVAVKAIRQEYAYRADFRRRILDEGRALAAIDHNNVVRLNAVVVQKDALYLVMQYIQGESLDRIIKRHNEQNTLMPLSVALNIFNQVLDGIGAVHDAGVVHRDLKPANILIRTRDSVAKVTDFGIAKDEQDAREGRGQTKGIIGSLLYMAPEQIKGQRDLDKRVDIYGLGILLFEMLTGRIPFDAPTDFDIMKLHLSGTVPFVSHIRPDVPLQLDKVIQKACAKNRDDRFSSTKHMAAAIASMNVPTLHSTGTLRSMGTNPFAPVAETPVYQAPRVQAYTGGTATSNQRMALEVTVPATRSGKRDKLSRWWVGWVLGAVVLFGAAIGILSAGFAVGWFDSDTGEMADGKIPAVGTDVVRGNTGAAATDGSHAVVPDVKKPEPLELLVGVWKSDTGVIYDAVMSGHALEFRLRTAGNLHANGYRDGEEKFTLLPLGSGVDDEFAVKDKIRPALPSDLKYDFERSRSSCQDVRTEVNGRALRARFDGKRLTVEGTKIAPERRMFLLRSKKVINCVQLHEAKVSVVQGTFERL